MFVVTAARREIVRHLTNDQRLWLRRLRRREHGWQGRQRELRRTLAAQYRGQTDPVTIGGLPVKVIHTNYDARAEARTSLRIIREALSAAGVEFVELPRLGLYDPVIVVRAHDTRVALDSLASLPAVEGWNFTGRTINRTPAEITGTSVEEVASVRAYRRILASNGLQLSTGAEHVTIEFWDVLGPNEPRSDGGTHLEGTVHRRFPQRGPLVEYFTPLTWRHVVDDQDSTARWPAPHLLHFEEPVDLVYTWVDGSDPLWLKSKLKAQGLVDPDQLNAAAANHSRYASRDELRYALRSAEYYASWFNHIYLVTDQQVPDWLDTTHPRLTIVDHRDIFTDCSVLPVFNSHAIESQLHHIDGLSEHYLYCNDDIMFMRPTTAQNFFTGNGLAKFFPSTAPLDLDPPSVRDQPVLSAAKRNRQFMIAEHGRTVSNKFKHTPQPQQRSVLLDLEDKYPEMFRQVSASRFRHPDDYSIPSALQHFHAYALGKAVPGSIRYAYLDIGRPDAELMLDRLGRRRLDVLCLNDTHVEPDHEQRTSAMLHSFLEERFPVPSSFELGKPLDAEGRRR